LLSYLQILICGFKVKSLFYEHQCLCFCITTFEFQNGNLCSALSITLRYISLYALRAGRGQSVPAIRRKYPSTKARHVKYVKSLLKYSTKIKNYDDLNRITIFNNHIMFVVSRKSLILRPVTKLTYKQLNFCARVTQNNLKYDRRFSIII